MIKYLITYELRTKIFLTPVYLFPFVYIQFNYTINILPGIFILYQAPFCNSLNYFGIPLSFQRYFLSSKKKLLIGLGITNLIWYNLFYMLSILALRIDLNASLKQIAFFELLLVTSIITGIILMTLIFKDPKISWERQLLVSIIFIITVSVVGGTGIIFLK